MPQFTHSLGLALLQLLAHPHHHHAGGGGGGVVDERDLQQSHGVDREGHRVEAVRDHVLVVVGLDDLHQDGQGERERIAELALEERGVGPKLSGESPRQIGDCRQKAHQRKGDRTDENRPQGSVHEGGEHEQACSEQIAHQIRERSEPVALVRRHGDLHDR